MTTVAPSNPVLQIAEALAYVRKAKHYDGCKCAMFRNAAGSPHCSAEEALWTKAVDRLIDNILDLKTGPELVQ
jgi:hypothetical protein